MRKLVRYILPISNKSSSKLHNFSCFTSKKWLWKQANSLLQLALKLCETKRAVQRHVVWCVASDFTQKRCVADSTRKQWVSDLYKTRWKSWRLTNHSARIVMPVLQNGFWLANLSGKKSLSCIDFFLHKFKQNAVHILVENYFTHRIPSYFLDTCTNKTSKRVKTILIKFEIKLKKDEVFHYFLNYHTGSENFIFYDELKIVVWKYVLHK